MDDLEVSCNMLGHITIVMLYLKLLDQNHIWLGLSRAIHYCTGLLNMLWRYHTKAWHHYDCKIAPSGLQSWCYAAINVLVKCLAPRAATEHPLLDQIHDWRGSSKVFNCYIGLPVILWRSDTKCDGIVWLQDSMSSSNGMIRVWYDQGTATIVHPPYVSAHYLP